MKRSLFTLVLGLMLSGNALASDPRSGFCSNTLLDVYPDAFYTCEALQSLEGGFDRHALALFRQAALWGDKQAQYRVGLMHLGGIGTEPDRVEGAAWLLLANERNNRTVTARLAQVRSMVDDAQWRTITARAAELREIYGDFPALERRDRWARETKRELTGSRTGHPMGTVEVLGPGTPSGLTGITGRQMLARLDAYVDGLQDVVTTVEYRDFKVLEEARP